MDIVDISFDKYKELDAISRSDLNLLEISAEHFLRKDEIFKESKSLDIGTAFHHFLLEPDLFFEKYIILDKGQSKRTKSGQEIKKMCDEKGMNLLNNCDFELIKKMHNGVRRNNLATRLIMDGMSEMTLIGVDEKTGIKIKARPDFMTEISGDEVTVIDLKTSKSARDTDFMRSVYKYNYHIQQYMIITLLKQKYKKVNFYFVVCEKESLYSCVVYTLSDDILMFAEEKYRDLMDYLKDCKDTGVYTGYKNKTLTL